METTAKHLESPEDANGALFDRTVERAHAGLRPYTPQRFVELLRAACAELGPASGAIPGGAATFDLRALHASFERCGGLASGAGFDRERFVVLASRLLRAGLHELPAYSPEFKLFAQQVQGEQAIAAHGTATEQEELVRLQVEWTMLLNEIGEVAFEVAQQQKRNDQTRVQYLRLFGGVEQELATARARATLADLRLMVKKENPTFTPAEVESRVAAVRDEQERAARQLASDRAWAQAAMAQFSLEGATADPEGMVRYVERVKKMLREIRVLLAPDRLERHPRWPELTQEQRQRLITIRNRTNRLRAVDLSFSPGQVGYDTPALEDLVADLRIAKGVLEIAGIDVDPEMLVRGDTPAEMLTWLRERATELRRNLDQLHATLLALRQDPEIAAKRDRLELPESHDEWRKHLRDLAEKARLQADQAEAEINALIEEHTP